MAAFTCLTDQCPDTCCRDWAVPVDRADLDRMKTAMSALDKQRGELARLVVLRRPTRGSAAPAQLRLDDHGACPMLHDDLTCSVHANLGEAALTTACSIFPRTSLAVAGELEIGGSLGCPEVARLTLLSPEPLRLAPAPRPMLPRPYVGKTVSSDPTDAYASHFRTVREALGACFDSPVGLGARFALAADLGDRLQPFFHGGTSEFEGAQRAFAERRLHAEIDATTSPELAGSLHRDLAGLRAPAGAALGLIATFIVERLRLPHSRRFAALVEGALPGASAIAAAPPGTPIDATGLWQAYQLRRDALDARTDAASAAIFASYAQHFLLRNPYTDAPRLLDYLYRLGAHLAAVRVLTVLDPKIGALLERAPDAADKQELGEVAVHAVQTFTKAIGHHPEYIDAALRQENAVTFGRLVLLAKIL